MTVYHIRLPATLVSWTLFFLAHFLALRGTLLFDIDSPTLQSLLPQFLMSPDDKLLVFVNVAVHESFRCLAFRGPFDCCDGSRLPTPFVVSFSVDTHKFTHPGPHGLSRLTG